MKIQTRRTVDLKDEFLPFSLPEFEDPPQKIGPINNVATEDDIVVVSNSADDALNQAFLTADEGEEDTEKKGIVKDTRNK